MSKLNKYINNDETIYEDALSMIKLNKIFY